MRRTLRLLLVPALVAAFASPSAAQNFRIFPTGVGGSTKAPHEIPPFTHWDLREFPDCQVPWVMGTAPVIDLNNNVIADEPADRALAQGVFATAFSRWDLVLPSDLGFINSGAGVGNGGAFLDGYNTVIFDPTTLPTDLNGAAFITRNANTGRIIEVDIVLNSDPTPDPFYGSRRWVMQSNGSAVAADIDYPPYGNWPTPADGDTDNDGDFIQEVNVDLLSIMIHEVGHLIGLGHVDPLGGAMNNPANNLMEQYWFLPLGPTGSGHANHTLKLADRDGTNFLYTPDLGDAPDPWLGITGEYPTLVHGTLPGRTLNGIILDTPGPGAEHILGIKPRNPLRNWTYEWLGRLDNANVDGECEANITDLDLFDDGVTWYPNPPVWGRPLNVTAWARHANDNVGNYHDYNTYGLWANAWLDLNQDGVWDTTPPEWFMFNVLTPAPLVGPNAVAVTPTSATVNLPGAVPYFNRPVWMRARLDYAEDVNIIANYDSTLDRPKGAAQFGEVEDYPLWCNRRYETHWTYFTDLVANVRGVRDVYVGLPDAGDELWGAEVNAGDCVVQPVQPFNMFTASSGDETTHDFVFDNYLVIGQYLHSGKCRPSTVMAPITYLRRYWLSTDFVAIGAPSPPPLAIPYAYRIPATNVGFCLTGNPSSPSGMLVQVGAPDIGSGGWLEPEPDGRTANADGSNAITWSDAVQVSVSYRVANGVLPLQSLSPCDPTYSALPQVAAGSGSVTPESPFVFAVPMPTGITTGQSLIVEVEASWSTNSTVNRQIVEFPFPVGGPTGVDPDRTPRSLALTSYPNPFNPSTTIRFALPEAGPVSLAVYDVSGRLVRSLLNNAAKPAGYFDAAWDATDDDGHRVASGVYFFRLTTARETLTRKAVLLK